VLREVRLKLQEMKVDMILVKIWKMNNNSSE
jgi:hypothetical protein